jgi:S-adenosyl methyltransferase
MQRPSWAPQGIELDRPSAARMYDYYLGGSHNFAIDRQAAEQAIAMWPDLPLIMQANRAFLRRAVRFLLAQGITQFLDIGSGIPTVGNVHEVAQQANPASRVVYVDIDPVAVAHSRAILAGNSHAMVVRGDARDPDALIAQPEVQRLLDLRQPVGVLLVALLHFVPSDEDAYRLVYRLRDVIAPGSYIAISHASFEGRPVESESHTRLYNRTPTPMMMRSRADVERLFDGLHIVEPGVVYLPLWRPESPDDVDDHPERFTGFAGVGRKD